MREGREVGEGEEEGEGGEEAGVEGVCGGVAGAEGVDEVGLFWRGVSGRVRLGGAGDLKGKGEGRGKERDEPSSSRASGVSSSSESGYWKVLRRRAWVREAILWVVVGGGCMDIRERW